MGVLHLLYKLQLYKVKGIIRLKLNAQSGIFYWKDNIEVKICERKWETRKLPK